MKIKRRLKAHTKKKMGSTDDRQKEQKEHIVENSVQSRYIITDFWADASINANGTAGLVARELRISLDIRDWYKFQKQPFYSALMQYLDNAQTQENT